MATSTRYNTNGSSVTVERRPSREPIKRVTCRDVGGNVGFIVEPSDRLTQVAKLTVTDRWGEKTTRNVGPQTARAIADALYELADEYDRGQR